MAWNQLEVEATVADYFHMLVMELSGQHYNKSAHRKTLLKKLENRTDAAVERKHQNISAILIEHGLPYISGYKPLGNYQVLLRDVVEKRLQADASVDHAAEIACSIPAASPLISDYTNLLVEAPSRRLSTREHTASNEATPGAQKRDYLAREARNISLGSAGEELVLAFERHRLQSSGMEELAHQVEHVSKTQGDGIGYDILSFDITGRERFIEVKTTSFGKETPFFISSGELRFAKKNAEKFHLYRLFDFRRNPRLFDLQGPVENHCLLDPVSYRCTFE